MAGAKQTIVDQLSSTTIRLKENLRTKPKISTALAVLAILVIAVSMRGLREPSAMQIPAPAPTVKAPVITKSTAPAPEPKVAAAPAQVPAPKEKAAGPAARERTAAAAAAKEKAVQQAAATPRSGPIPAPEPTSTPTPTPAAAEEAAEPGFIAFAITPWGEVYVDGKKLGVSPPLQEIQIGAGRHRVEIRNTTFPPHVQAVEVKSGERIRIRYLFR